MSKDFEYKIEYEVDKETGEVVATIPELNHVSSFGSTFKEAEKNVREAAILYCEFLLSAHKTIPSPSSHTEGTYLKINLPTSA